MSLAQSVVDRLDIDLDERVAVGQLNSQTCVQVAREGGFLLLYSRWHKPDIRWVWMDTDNHTLCWEDHEGHTTKIWFSRVKRVSSGSRSAFFKALDPLALQAAASSAGGGGKSRKHGVLCCAGVRDEDSAAIDYKTQAFEISLFKRMGAIKRHYRFIAHDVRECHTWLAALAVCWHAASATSAEIARTLSTAEGKRPKGEVGFEFHRSFWHDQTKATKESVCRFIHLLKFVQIMQLPCDARCLQQLFQEHDIHEVGFLNAAQFNSLMHQLLNVTWLRAAFKLPPGDTLSADVVKASLTDFQLESAPRLQTAIDRVIESNPYNTSDNKNLTFLGINALLKHTENSLLDLVSVEGHGKLDLPLDRYWIRATHNPFGGSALRSPSDVALALADTISRGYRCFVIDVCPGVRMSGPVIKPNDRSDLELTLNKFCYILASCAFLKETLPVLILLNLQPTMDSEFYRAAASTFEKELDGMLFKLSSSEEFPSLHLVRRKILLGFFLQVLEGYLPAGLPREEAYQSLFLPPGSTSPVSDEMLTALSPMLECCSLVFSRESGRYRAITCCDFVKAWPLREPPREGDDDEDTQVDEHRHKRFAEPLIGSWWQPQGTLTCLTTQNQPLVTIDFEIYFSGVQIVCENRQRVSYAGRALFPTNEAFVPIPASCVPTVLTVDVMQGYMLPNASAPYVEIWYYGYGQNTQEMHGLSRNPDGTVDPSSSSPPPPHVSWHHSHQASVFDDLTAHSTNLKIVHRFRSKTVVGADITPEFGLSTMVALANEHAAIMVVLVRNDQDGAGPIIASNAYRVSWLRSGIRWMPLRDANCQQLIPWAGLWLRIYKSTKPKARPERKKRPDRA